MGYTIVNGNSLKKIIEFAYSEESVLEKKYSKPFLVICEEKIFSKYLTKKSRILEVGCTTGRISISLSKKGYKVIGIDISKKAINSAKKLKVEYNSKLCEFIIANAIELPFKDNIFDYILFPVKTIEAIPSKCNRKKAILEASRCLKENGYLLFSIHSRFHPHNLLKFLKNELLRIIAKFIIKLNLDRKISNKKRYIIRLLSETEFGTRLIKEHYGSIYFHWYLAHLFPLNPCLRILD